MPTTKFIWDELSDNVMYETDKNGTVTAEYNYRPEPFGELISQTRNGVTRYYHYDGMGSISELTDESGNVTDTYRYTAYGEEFSRTGSTTNPFGYKGALGYYTNSATDDIYVRARTYQPALGRWLSRDPLGFIDGTSLYRAYFVPGGVDPGGEHIIHPNDPDCFDICVKNGGPHGFCAQLCDTDLTDTSRPDWPICWGHELGDESFFPPESESDDGACGCKCVSTEKRLRLVGSGCHWQRPRGTLPNAPLPTAGDTDVPCKNGELRTMRYLAQCEGEKSCGSCFEYRLWECVKQRRRKRVDGKRIEAIETKWRAKRKLLSKCDGII